MERGSIGVIIILSILLFVFFVFAKYAIDFFDKKKEDKILMIDPGGHTGLIRDVISVNADEIITGSDDKTIRIWDTKQGIEKRKILGQIDNGQAGKIYAIALSPDGKWLAAAGFMEEGIGAESNYIRIYDYKTGQLEKLLLLHTNTINDLHFSKDGKYLVSCSFDTVVGVWDVPGDFSLSHSFTTPNYVYDVKIFKHNEEYKIIAAYFDNEILLYNLNTREISNTQETDHVQDNFAISNKYIASCGGGNVINIYDKNLEIVTQINDVDSPSGLSFSPDGAYLLAGSTADNPVCLLFDTMTFKPVKRFDNHDNIVIATGFLDNYTAITCGGDDFDIYLWDIYSGQPIKHIASIGLTLWSLGLDDGVIYYGSKWTDNSRTIGSKLQRSFNIKDGNIQNINENTPGISEKFVNLRPDIRKDHDTYSMYHAAGGEFNYNDARLVIKNNGRKSAEIIRESSNGYSHQCYTFSQDGYIITGGLNGALEAYDTDGILKSSFIGHTGAIRTTGEDNGILISGGNDQIIKLWDLNEVRSGNATIKPFLNIFINKEKEWVFWTADGHYNASPGAGKYIGYHINHGREKTAEFVNFDELKDELYKPDIINEILTEKFGSK